MSPWHYGLNQGPLVLMIENYRSELLWRLTRRSPYIVSGLRRAGFHGGWLQEPRMRIVRRVPPHRPTTGVAIWYGPRVSDHGRRFGELPGRDAVDILNERYARDEITQIAANPNASGAQYDWTTPRAGGKFVVRRRKR